MHKYQTAGVVEKHKFEKSEAGVLQGGALSPLISNIMLNEREKNSINEVIDLFVCR